jgi:hypothetical protein
MTCTQTDISSRPSQKRDEGLERNAATPLSYMCIYEIYE